MGQPVRSGKKEGDLTDLLTSRHFSYCPSANSSSRDVACGESCVAQRPLTYLVDDEMGGVWWEGWRSASVRVS